MKTQPFSNHVVRTAGIAIAFAASTSLSIAWADDEPMFAPLALDAAIPYSDKDTFDDDIVNGCDWNRTVPKYLVEESDGRISFVADGAAAARRLKLVTQTLHAIGGGAITGPKWLVIDGTLTDGGRTIGTFEARRQSYRGSLTTCRTLRGLGEEIADDILKWLPNPAIGSRLGDAR